jgi:hypothetical protein
MLLLQIGVNIVRYVGAAELTCSWYRIPGWERRRQRRGPPAHRSRCHDRSPSFPHNRRIGHQQSRRDGQSPRDWHSRATDQGYDIIRLASASVRWEHQNLRLELRAVGANQLLEHAVVIPQAVPPHRNLASSG